MKKVNGIIENQKLAYRVALILMLVWGIAMSVLIPSWQTPDENDHLSMIASSWNNPEMSGYLYSDMDMDAGRIWWNYDEKIDISKWQTAMTQTPSYSRSDCMPNGFNLSVIRHLSASMGLFIGILFHLPTFWVMALGEWTALAFALFLYALALHFMPVKKEVLLLIMAFPMTMQQISSINYDSLLLPLCFLFVAYVLYLRIKKEEICWRDLVFLSVLCLWIAYIKVPYILLGLLIFLLPCQKFRLRIRKRVISERSVRIGKKMAVVLIILAVCAGGYVFRDNFWVSLILTMVQELRRTCLLFRETWRINYQYWIISSVGMFGWLESALPYAFCIATYVLGCFLAICGTKEEGQFRLKICGKIFIWLVFFAMCGLVCASMIDHTARVFCYGFGEDISYSIREALYQIGYIAGIQGRYFIPLLILPYMTFPVINREVKAKTWIAAGYVFVAMLFTVYILLQRYWFV